GHRQRAGGEVGAVVQGQQVAGARLEPAADVRAELVRGHRVRAVNLRTVEEGGDAVDLLARVAGTVAGRRVERGARGRNDPGRVEGVARLVGRDVERLATVGRGEVEVVVEELAEHVGEVRQTLVIDGVDVLGRVVWVGLIEEGVADGAGAGPIGPGGRAHPVGVRRRGGAGGGGSRSDAIPVGPGGVGAGR